MLEVPIPEDEERRLRALRALAVLDRAASPEEARRLLSTPRYAALALDRRSRPGSDGATGIDNLLGGVVPRRTRVLILREPAEASAAAVEAKLLEWLQRCAEPARVGDVDSRRRAPHLPTVLHVEDDADNRQIVERALAGVAQVRGAESLAAARAALAGAPVDMVMLDLELPDGCGSELLAEIDGQPVVIFSGSDPDTRLSDPIRAWLIKAQTTTDELREQVRSALARPTARETPS